MNDEPTHAAPQTPVSRLAPSPTGALHLGNARTFMINWAMARQDGWKLIMRIEDLDTPRVKAGVVDEMLDILEWIGIDFDGDPITQSHDTERHEEAMRSLASKGLVYPCELTRSQIEAAASAPHEADASHENRFDESWRPDLFPDQFDDTGTNWRIVTDRAPIRFNDLHAGNQEHDPGAASGDFVVWTKRQAPSYQLACAVDDAHQGITHIIRGSDLLESTARQIHIRRSLGITDQPTHIHVPLVRGPDGRRLAKRHGDTRLSAYRSTGTHAERMIGLLAYWCSITSERSPMDAQEFLERFDLGTLRTEDVTFTQDDDDWLTSC